MTKPNTEAQRRRRERLRADPVAWAAYLKKQTEYKRKSNANDPLAQRARNIKYSYGVTPEYVESLWESQGRVCPGCGDSLPNPAGLVERHGCHIDHCHSSGKVRGILCRKCNLALGHAKDNPDVLRALARYLEK